MSKEQVFIRVQALYNASGTIWPVEVEFTHTTGEPPTLAERLNAMSKSGFIPANQVAIVPGRTNGERSIIPHCQVHQKPMKISKRQPKDGSKAYYCSTKDDEGDGYCNQRATVSAQGNVKHFEVG
jgi:hypothetical protein